MKIEYLKVKLLKIFFVISTFLILLTFLFIRPCHAQLMPYYPPVFVDPFYYLSSLYLFYNYPVYDFYSNYSYPIRNASVLSATSLLALSLLTPTVTPTTSYVLGVNTAITLAILGGSSLSTTALAALSTTPVLTTPVTTTPTIGTTTALLLGGGVSTSTLLLLGI